LAIPEVGVVLDAGTGMFRLRDEIETEALDIFLSHAHLDHVIGLTFLFDVLWEKNVRQVTAHARPEFLTAIQEHLFAKPIFPVQPPCEFKELAQETPLAGGGRLIAFPLEHPGGSTGFRLEWPGHSLAYVTDTTARTDAPYVEQICGVDLLVHECYFDDTMTEHARLTGHSCTTPVAEVAAAAGVGRLLAVHVNPLDPRPDPINLGVARAIFPRIELAQDGMEVEF
jgi:ribonuclease BN (tRNA processing enzyme)